MNMNLTDTLVGHQPGGTTLPCETNNKIGEAVDEISPMKDDSAGEHGSERPDHITPRPTVIAEKTLDPSKVKTVSSIRNKILAARKAPEEVARLMSTQNEQVSVPLYKRLPDGAYWRVRSGEEWEPENSEVLLLPRKDAGGGPEFLLVLPELEPLFQNDARLRNLVRYHHLAFAINARGRVGWWAVPSRSDNDWHVSARTIMRRLKQEWGMPKSDMGSKGYNLEKPQDNLGNAAWPQGSYDEWFLKGLSDKVLDSEDHPVLKELLGRK